MANPVCQFSVLLFMSEQLIKVALLKGGSRRFVQGTVCFLNGVNNNGVSFFRPRNDARFVRFAATDSDVQRRKQQHFIGGR